MFWDGADSSGSLAKDIMAAANSRDGGVIVIGKAENGNQFELLGLTPEEAGSFDTTKVANWINSRCQPSVELTCYRVTHEGKQFIVVVVKEFSDIPVICTKDYQPQNEKKPVLRAGTIYVRTANSESAPLTTPDALRGLIGLATTKRADQMLSSFQAMLQGHSLLPAQSNGDPYAEEIEEMTATLGRTLGKSASMGTWTLQFHPERLAGERWTTEQLPPLVRKNAVRSRGDLYPGDTRNIRYTNTGIMEDDGGRAAYGVNRSGLVMYRFCYPENSRTYHCRWTPPDCPDFPAGAWLEFPLNLFVLVEFFWFMGRMAHELQPGERLACELSATGLRGRRLVTLDFNVGLHPTEPCIADKFTRKRVVTAEAMRVGWETECVDTLCDFFRLFSGDAIDRETFAKWAKKVQQPGA